MRELPLEPKVYRRPPRPSNSPPCPFIRPSNCAYRIIQFALSAPFCGDVANVVAPGGIRKPDVFTSILQTRGKSQPHFRYALPKQ